MEMLPSGQPHVEYVHWYFLMFAQSVILGLADEKQESKKNICRTFAIPREMHTGEMISRLHFLS